MLTGDNAGAARSVAAAAGLDATAVHANLLPEDKLRQVCSHTPFSYNWEFMKALNVTFWSCRKTIEQDHAQPTGGFLLSK